MLPNKYDIKAITPKMMAVILYPFLFVRTLSSSSCVFMKSTANTGLMIYATTNDASKVMIRVIGKKNINLPITPCQNASGINGARVVMVPAKTGRNTSPAAIFAAFLIGTFPLAKILCVFSTTTIASSTTIPKANRNEKSTIKLSLNPMAGKTIKAMAHDNGTDMATNMALVAPMKNIKITVTKMNPMMMVLIKSCNVVRVSDDWSPVMVILTPSGKMSLSYRLVISAILSDASIKFSPLFLITLSVITGLCSRRAKLSFSLNPSFTSAISFKYTVAPVWPLSTISPILLASLY